MASTEESGTGAFVLSRAAVRSCIDDLLNRKIHPFFPAYLHLRQRAVNLGASTVEPHWPELATLLEMEGGPPNKPYYRPFWNQSRGAGQEWLNKNIAGSYAGSSIRGQPLKVVTYGEGAFGFRDRHWEAAREFLLYEQRAPAVSIAGFFYRDFAFQTQGDTPMPPDLVTIFRQDFEFDASSDSQDKEFEYLFDTTPPGGEGHGPWFEPLSVPAPS